MYTALQWQKAVTATCKVSSYCILDSHCNVMPGGYINSCDKIQAYTLSYTVYIIIYSLLFKFIYIISPVLQYILFYQQLRRNGGGRSNQNTFYVISAYYILKTHGIDTQNVTPFVR